MFTLRLERRGGFRASKPHQTAGLPIGAVINCADNSGKSLLRFPYLGKIAKFVVILHLFFYFRSKDIKNYRCNRSAGKA